MLSESERIGVPLLLFFLMAVTIQVAGLNIPLFNAFNPVLRWLPDSVWAHITLLGDALVVLALINILALRYPQLLAAGLLAALVATVLSRGLKAAFALERPLAVLGEQVHVIGIALHTDSFPSGHTTAAFVLAGLCLLATPSRWAVLGLLGAMAVGLSRVAVGAHWHADISLGAATGLLAAWLGWHLAKPWQWATRKTGQYVLSSVFLGFALLLFALDSGYPQANTLQYVLAVAASAAGCWQLWRIRQR